MIATWLERLGLSQYLGSLPSHISGSSLVSAGPHHLEKLLGMKNHLHRKKLILAMRSQLSSRPNPVDHIDHNWVIRWLDDIGLPQHKEAFSGLYAVFVSQTIVIVFQKIFSLRVINQELDFETVQSFPESFLL